MATGKFLFPLQFIAISIMSHYQKLYTIEGSFVAVYLRFDSSELYIYFIIALCRIEGSRDYGNLSGDMLLGSSPLDR